LNLTKKNLEILKHQTNTNSA